MMAKGRRALTGTTKQDVLRIRLDDAERKLLDQAAAISGKPTSTWARDTLLQLAASQVAQQPAKPGKKTGMATAKKPKA